MTNHTSRKRDCFPVAKNPNDRVAMTACSLKLTLGEKVPALYLPSPFTSYQKDHNRHYQQDAYRQFH
jgi:hypothetical protein